MQYKQRACILSALTLSLVVLCLTAPAMADTWVVNPDGTEDFTSVQAALDSDWISGDTIEIAYSVYKEPVAVDAGGRDLTITGVPSPAGDFPIIDGMNGAVDLPGLSNGGGCGGCAMYLYNGNFDVSRLSVINASYNGLVARAMDSGQAVHATDVRAADNGWCGINIKDYDEAVVTGIVASNNAFGGIHVVNTAYLEGTDLVCTENGGDGLFVRGSDSSVTEIARVRSTGNHGDGVVLNGFADFNLSDMEIDGNGVESDLRSCNFADTQARSCRINANGEADACVCAAETDAVVRSSGVAPAIRYEGNGLFVANSVNGTIDGVEATNNAAIGIFVDVTGDVVISNCSADENGYLGILTISVSDEYPLVADLISDIDIDMDDEEMTEALETFFTGMGALVENARAVSEDEFVLGDGVSLLVEDIMEDGPDVTLSSVAANNNGYAGIGVIAPGIAASDIAAHENGACPRDTAGSLSGAGIVGMSFVGEYSGIDSTDNGGAGMAAASLSLGIEDAVLTGNGGEADSDIHGPFFQTGLLTVSLVNAFSGVQADQNAGSGMLMTSVITLCDECSASGNGYGGIVAVDPLSLGIAALLAHGGLDDMGLFLSPGFINIGSSGQDDLSDIPDAMAFSEEDRFYLESLSSPAMQDVMACYGETVPFASSAAADFDIDNITEEDVALFINLLHQYRAISGCVMVDSAADDNGLFGMTAVYPNVTTFGFSAERNGDDDGNTLTSLAGIGIFGMYLNGTFFDTSVSENTGAGMVTVGVVSEYNEVTADNNGYAGIVTIDPLTLAAAALGYFVVLDASGDELFFSAMADAPDTTDLAMHADIADSAVVQEIVATYFSGVPAGEATVNQVAPPMDDPMEILLEHIEFYFTYAGVHATDVSASGNGYPGFVAIGPNVVMKGVTADNNGAVNDDDPDIIGLAAGSGIIGLSIVGNYTDITASRNTGAGIATAGVVTDMTSCEADENGVGVLSLFVIGDHTDIGADENGICGVILAGITGTLTDSVAIGNAGSGIVCVDPVAAALMYLTVSPTGISVATVDDLETASPEAMGLLCQLSGNMDMVPPMSGEPETETETETAWSLIEWAIMHISSYEGDITSLNETEIIDLLLTHYLTGAELSVSNVVVNENGWYGVAVLSPSIMVEDACADGNGYHGVSVMSPWKAVDAAGWAHPAEPVGDERLSVINISVMNNGAAGLAVSGANAGEVVDVYGSENLVGILLSDSDHLLVSDTIFETNWIASVVCGGSLTSSLIPTDEFLWDELLSDPTGSCDNVFVETAVDEGVVIFTNSTGNHFIDTFFDEEREIAAHISGDGPYVIYSMSGYGAPELPPCGYRDHMGGCGIGVVGAGGYNTTVNVTYDYSHGYPLETGKKLYPQWAVNATTPWESWRFNAITKDLEAMTVGPMVVPVCCPATVPVGEFSDVMYIAPFWQEERCDDDPGYDMFMQSLAENKKTGYIGPDGVFVPYGPEGPPVEGAGDDNGANDGDNDGAGDSDGDDTSPVSNPAAAGVTATATVTTTTPVPTTTPAGVIPVIGALGILAAIAITRRR